MVPSIPILLLLPPLAAGAHAGGRGGGRAAGSGHGGLFIGVDGAASFLLANRADMAQTAGAFGARFGFDFPNGLTLYLRYDDLGVTTAIPSSGARGTAQMASVGARYSVPFIVPIPFAEGFAGPAFLPGESDFGGGFGAGVSFPLFGHFFIDAFGRGYLIPIDGTLRPIITAGLGASISFASAGH